jgi:predicted site-specific integrase-resolvase
MSISKSSCIPTYSNISLAEWGRIQGISYKTAWRMYRDGRLPEGLHAERLPTGTIRVREVLPPAPNGSRQDAAFIYARINPRQAQADLDLQISLCRTFCAARGWTILKTITESAPALGLGRHKLHRLLDPPPRRLVIWKESILSRFDFRIFELLLRSCQCELVIVDRSDDSRGEGGALEDLVDAVSAVCHRHYGVKRGNLLLQEFRKLMDAKRG